MAARWTEAAITQLRTLHEDGMSGGTIALELGIHRNAVNGKLKRLGLKAERAPRVCVPKKTAPAPTAPPPEPVRANAVFFFDLKPHHCRWMLGEGLASPICGERRSRGSSYCEYHRRKSMSAATLSCEAA